MTAGFHSQTYQAGLPPPEAYNALEKIRNDWKSVREQILAREQSRGDGMQGWWSERAGQQLHASEHAMRQLGAITLT